MAKCKTCDREIIWVKTATSKALPLDARPVTVYQRTNLTQAGRHRAYFDDTGEEIKLYVSHFLTCPQAAAHSGKGHIEFRYAFMDAIPEGWEPCLTPEGRVKVLQIEGIERCRTMVWRRVE